MRATILGGLVLAIGLTAACAEREQRTAAAGNTGGGFCTPFAAAPAEPTDPAAAAAPATAPGGEAAAFDDCLHRWGYRLARSKDTAMDVAQAVVAACTPSLVRWNQQTLSQLPPGTSDNAVSLVTGRAGTTPEDRYGMAQGKALFYVVQARAGNCPLP